MGESASFDYVRPDDNLQVQSLLKKIKYLEVQKQNAESDKVRLQREVEALKKELERLRTPPLITATVTDVMIDGRAVVKSSTGPNFVVGVSQLIKADDLIPGTLVALNQRTLSILEVLPSSKDPMVSGMEVVNCPDTSFSEIGGLKSQIEEIQEMVELPLLHPELFEKIGIEPPNGVLLYGPPGNGKTQLAKAVAGETSSTFIKVVASEFVRKYIGEGARLVRETFRLAREKAPSVIFIDELDAIGATRTESNVSGDREVQRTLMQLLSEMDGFEKRENVKILAATNRPDILDTALLRPGRFDRLVEVPMPNKEGRESIFKIHSKKMNLKGVEFTRLVECADGASGAQIKAICTEAGMFAVRERRKSVSQEDFDRAIDKVLSKDVEKKQEDAGIFR
ncbi:MAG TPA: proteasome-activating nucleotidase [Candidatus Methanofastidiosa archaeon]|nr:proteasome-activating nucleotidase [Candidatus Methanofastidiosa archaeon]HPR41995.1 proteasome-activating nucleotidase [Candidatus Methanofastidiosa archaeon]